ncbi:hypothetical protein L1049_006374 [Liquidambar formosana]|uniref:C2 domain-containing protein n=1 Tax=Liquidambar formosana TaxID=63359 RepID=A0AAP0RFF5_LIQFO
MEMEWSSIELKVMSCRNVKAFNFFQKLSVYVVVSILEDDKKQRKQKPLQRQKTGIDKDGDGNPEWNHVIHFDLKGICLPLHHLFLKFHLRCDGIVYGNKTIGQVTVPLKDLILHHSNGDVRFLSYQVTTAHGKPNGVFKFSYKMIHGGNRTPTTTTTTTTESGPPALDSSSSLSLSSGVDFPTEKIRYPSVEEDDDDDDDCPSPGICYPSVEVEYSPPQEIYRFPSQTFYYQTPALPLPPVEPPGAILYYTPPPPPPPPPRPYEYVLDLEWRGYDYNYGGCGYPGVVGQLERFHDDSWRLPTGGDGFPALWTRR